MYVQLDRGSTIGGISMSIDKVPYQSFLLLLKNSVNAGEYSINAYRDLHGSKAT